MWVSKGRGEGRDGRQRSKGKDREAKEGMEREGRMGDMGRWLRRASYSRW